MNPLPGAPAARHEGVDDRTNFECRICWYVYDPDVGDPQEQIPGGTPFRNLPARWRCPECDAGPELFLARCD